MPPGSRLHAPWVWRPGAQPEFLAELADAVQALPRPIRLILDDVHELVDPVALHGLHTLMRNRPTGFQLVLSSRFDPPLSLPRLRLAGRLCELRADRLRFSPAETATLLERSGLNLTPAQVDTLHQRTGGWAAGLRLAALALSRTTDRDAFLNQFSGNDSSVADYLVGEVLSALPDDSQEFLRVISISDPVPSRLAAAADRPGRRRQPARPARPPDLAADRHRTTARHLPHPGTAAHLPDRRPAAPGAHPGRPSCTPSPPAGGPARISRSPPWTTPPTAATRRCCSELLHRFAMPLILTGDHGPLRRALASVGAAGHRVRSLAGPDLRPGPTRGRGPVRGAGRPAPRAAGLARPRHRGPGRPTGGRRAAGRPAEEPRRSSATDQRRPTSRPTDPAGDRFAIANDSTQLPAEPELEALARLSRGTALLERDDRAGARAELDAALDLGRRHGFDYLSMQCLALLGVVAGTCGDVRTMRRGSTEALAAAADHGWPGSTWSAAATAMLGLRRAPALRRPPRPNASPPTRSPRAAACCRRRCGSPCRPSTVPRSSTWVTGRTGWPSCNRPAPSSATTTPARSSAPRWRRWSSAPPCCSGTPPRPAPSWAG